MNSYRDRPRIRQPRLLGTGSASIALLVALAGCGADGADSNGAVIRDSAGVRIVENTAPLWSEGKGWQLAQQPALSIGELEGDPEYQLYQVADARRLSDGRIVVANAGTYELRFYDSKGRFMSAGGGEGGGPGEFKELTGLWTFADDSMITYDYRSRRISIFEPSGTFARSFQLHGVTGARSHPLVIAPFTDGSLLIDARPALDVEVQGGIRRDSTLYLRCSPEGELVDSLGWFPGPEWYVKRDENSMAASVRALGRRPHATVHGNRSYFGSSDSFEIGHYDARGRLTRLIRKAQTNLPVTAEDVERWKQDAIADQEDEIGRTILGRLLDDMPFPETMPAYRRLIVDSEANLWVEEYRRPGDDQPRWTVFDPQGVMLGTVETPPNLEVYQVASDFVLGRRTDELGVESVQLYKLKRR
ncbi:MAG: hypothetical protein PVG79_08630 [Gemmatimonadales bacterium]